MNFDKSMLELSNQSINYVMEKLKPLQVLKSEKISDTETVRQETLEINADLYEQTSDNFRKVILPEVRGNFTGVKFFSDYVSEIQKYANFGIIRFMLNNEIKSIRIKSNYENISDDDLKELGMLTLFNAKKIKTATIYSLHTMECYSEIKRYKVINIEFY